MIGVVILNFNDYAMTIKCTDNLLKYNDKLEIVIVDNASTNNSLEHLNNYYLNEKVSIIHSKTNGGYSSGNNIGLKYLIAQYPEIKYLCIVNPDVLIESDVFNYLADVLDVDEQIAAISPLMCLNGRIDLSLCFWNIPNGIEVFRNHFIFNKRKVCPIFDFKNNIVFCEAIPGSFFMIRSDVLDKIGYLDEGTFLYNEENILAIKIKNLGLRSAVLTTCFYNHLHKSSKRNSIRVALRNQSISNQSRIYLAKTYYSRFSCIMVKAVSMINNCLIVLARAYKFALRIKGR